MPLPLPNLDDRTFADLVDEARALIPTYDPSWTDHNPSDPGITLIELFAWLTEMLIYRANRVPDRHLITFLKLLNGPDWKPGPDLPDDIRTSIVALRRRYQAVTCEDYEALAREASVDVARVKCIPRRYLDAGTEADRTAPQPGHVSVIVVPRSAEAAPQPPELLRQKVWNYLDPRRVLTTRHHVVGPFYAPVSAEILIARRADMPEAVLRKAVVVALNLFLDPLMGGPDGDGWPFGRDVYVSELYELLEGIPGVDYVPDIMLSSRCPSETTRCVAARELWHEDGELIGLDLAPHHLPQAQIDPARIIISAAFVPVQVAVQLRSKATVEPATARRAVQTAVKHLFHPLYGGPDGTAVRVITVDSIRASVRDLPEIENVVDIVLLGDPKVTSVRFEERELADVQVTVIILQ